MESETTTGEAASVMAETEDHTSGRTGFGWGLAVGILSAALLVAVVIGVGEWYYFTSMFDSMASNAFQTVSINPVAAGEPWFEVKGDGTGTLEGWPNGSSGSSGDGHNPEYSFDVMEVGAVEDVPVVHSVSVNVDDKTEFYVGDKEFRPSKNVTTLDAIFGMDDEAGSEFTYGDMRLKIEFRSEGGSIVATRVTAIPGSEPAPILY